MYGLFNQKIKIILKNEYVVFLQEEFMSSVPPVRLQNPLGAK